MRLTWPIIESPRLLLRPLSPHDVADVYAYASHPDVAALSGWPPHASRDDTRRFLEGISARYAAGVAAPWGIVLKETSTVIGTVGFVQFAPQHRRGQIAGALAANHWGKGLMTEAAVVVLQHAFRTLRLARVEAVCRTDHEAAIAVAEKLGMLREGFLRDYLIVHNKPMSVVLYSVLRADFLEQSQHRAAADRHAAEDARPSQPPTAPPGWGAGYGTGDTPPFLFD